MEVKLTWCHIAKAPFSMWPLILNKIEVWLFIFNRYLKPLILQLQAWNLGQQVGLYPCYNHQEWLLVCAFQRDCTADCNAIINSWVCCWFSLMLLPKAPHMLLGSKVYRTQFLLNYHSVTSQCPIRGNG